MISTYFWAYLKTALESCTFFPVVITVGSNSTTKIFMCGVLLREE